jgi:adenylate cyclase 8
MFPLFLSNFCVTFLSKEVIPKTAIMVLLLVVFLIMVTYHARLVEVTSRLDFLWKQQAERELADMMETRANNTQLLKNILPDHVAQHFLEEDRPTEVGTAELLAGRGQANLQTCKPQLLVTLRHNIGLDGWGRGDYTG